jgi:hypothetical protein
LVTYIRYLATANSSASAATPPIARVVLDCESSQLLPVLVAAAFVPELEPDDDDVRPLVTPWATLPQILAELPELPEEPLSPSTVGAPMPQVLHPESPERRNIFVCRLAACIGSAVAF